MITHRLYIEVINSFYISGVKGSDKGPTPVARTRAAGVLFLVAQIGLGLDGLSLDRSHGIQARERHRHSPQGSRAGRWSGPGLRELARQRFSDLGRGRAGVRGSLSRHPLR